LLTQAGCQASFDQADDGSTLTVTIDNCEVTEGTLFSCGFRSGDLQALNASTAGACECALEPICHLNGSTCYQTPGICVSENPAADDCEDCGNDLDDDGDGEADCDDGDCFLDCGFGLSTITCSSTTVSTITTSTAP
jgi:hypothetical protein